MVTLGDLLLFLWEIANEAGIFYLLWLIQTWYMLGLILR
jgi:hypothetical protein